MHEALPPPAGCFLTIALPRRWPLVAAERPCVIETVWGLAIADPPHGVSGGDLC